MSASTKRKENEVAEEPQAAPPALPREGASIPPGRGARKQPWVTSFVLFAVGFVILIVASKIGPAGLYGTLLKGLGAAFCVVGLVLARRSRLKNR